MLGHHRPAGEMPFKFRWHADNGHLDILSPHQLNELIRVGSPLTKLSESVHVKYLISTMRLASTVIAKTVS